MKRFDLTTFGHVASHRDLPSTAMATLTARRKDELTTDCRPSLAFVGSFDTAAATGVPIQEIPLIAKLGQSKNALRFTHALYFGRNRLN